MRVRIRSSLGSVTARVLFWASTCFEIRFTRHARYVGWARRRQPCWPAACARSASRSHCER